MLKRFFREGGSTEDFRRMFANVDAVTDVPCVFFWEEILEAFPEAKVILGSRQHRKANTYSEYASIRYLRYSFKKQYGLLAFV